MSSEIQTTDYGKISASFSKSNLAKLCVEKIGVQTGPFGSQLHNEDYVVIGTPIITVEHLGENRITYQNMPRVSDEDKARLSKYCLQEGDIVFSRVGSVDRRALVRQEEDGWLFSGRCLRVRVDKAKIDPVYLSYFFGLEGFKNYIKSIAVGATMPSLNTKILSDVPIYFPEIENQKKMGKILQELDDKIELNHQINQILESIAQTIFKSWFVDFEPVKAKIAAIKAGEDAGGVTRAAMRAISGKTDDELKRMQAGQPENYTKLKTTAELFPSAMQETELGEVPEGWRVMAIQNLAKIIKGKSYSSAELVESNTALVTLKSFNRGGGYRLDGLKEYTGSYKAEQEVFAGDLIIAYTDVTQNADVIGKPAMVVSDSRYEHLVISLDVAVVRPEIDCHKYFLYGLAMTDTFQNHTRSYTAGTTVLHLGKSAVPGFQFPKPSEELLSLYEQNVSHIFKLVNENIEENKNIERLRDALLPKLMSGEIRVNVG